METPAIIIAAFVPILAIITVATKRIARKFEEFTLRRPEGSIGEAIFFVICVVILPTLAIFIFVAQIVGATGYFWNALTEQRGFIASLLLTMTIWGVATRIGVNEARRANTKTP